MPETKMIVLAKATDGRTEELQHWYRTQHIADVLAVPGFKSAELMSTKLLKIPEESPEWDFIAIYIIDAEDPMTAVVEAGRRMGTELMPRSDSLFSEKTLSLLGIAISQ